MSFSGGVGNVEGVIKSLLTKVRAYSSESISVLAPIFVDD